MFVKQGKPVNCVTQVQTFRESGHTAKTLILKYLNVNIPFVFVILNNEYREIPTTRKRAPLFQSRVCPCPKFDVINISDRAMRFAQYLLA